jgi:hypothetical protein
VPVSCAILSMSSTYGCLIPVSNSATSGQLRIRDPVGQAALGGRVGQNQGMSTTPTRRRPSEHCRAGRVVDLVGAERVAGDGVTKRCARYDELALRDVTEALDMTIKLIGTPAEESSEGKVQLLRRGYSATW